MSARAAAFSPIPSTSTPPRRAYSIDELAAVTGVPSRTIRFYQAKGALPSPERHGRVAVYRDEHVDRLKLVAELQGRGLHLRAIREVLHQVERGDLSVREWMGVGEQLRAPWSEDEPQIMREHEIAELLGIPTLPADLLAALKRSGAVEQHGDAHEGQYHVRSPALLGVGAKLQAAGIDVPTTLGAEKILRRRLGQAADETVAYFFEHLGQGGGRKEHVVELEKAVKAMRTMGLEAMRLILAHEIERAVRQRLEAGPAVPSRRRRR